MNEGGAKEDADSMSEVMEMLRSNHGSWNRSNQGKEHERVPSSIPWLSKPFQVFSIMTFAFPLLS